MTAARNLPSATLLPNGEVLVAGGLAIVVFQAFVPNSAELYDPQTGIWTATGSMTAARFNGGNGQLTTLLANGEVLIAGGDGSPYGDDAGTSNNGLNSAELYTP